MADDTRPVSDTRSAVLTGHRMIRDGSFWRCVNGCGTEVPFPSPMPDLAADCWPRRWLVDGD